MHQDAAGKKYALVVEDEPTISRACQRVLVSEGFEVDVAGNGLIAQELIANKSYDLCLSDIKLPKVNGMDLFKYIEKEYPTLADKVIFTTGDILSGDIGIFLRETDRPFLPKPFTPEDLRSILKRF